MNTQRVTAAAGVLHAAMQQGKSLPQTLAYDLEAAQLLQSPETAAELVRLRARVAELEATVGAAFGQARYRDHFGDIWEERPNGKLELVELFGANALAEVGVQARATTVRLSWGPLEKLAPSGSATVDAHCFTCGEGLDDENITDFCSDRCQAAQGTAPVEDPHDSPLHHTYRIPRELPEVPRG
ncbi:hypothetical protein [Streptomyces sp. NPDC048551]|uniref:hypothetical protein n=1 Tax=Streptomyces sp. NPDC048551 TaxID=3155758 RepID=UPI003442432C